MSNIRAVAVIGATSLLAIITFTLFTAAGLGGLI